MNAFALFGASTLASFVSSAVAARLFAWPRLQNADPNRALTLLVVPHMFLRFIGLSLLVPGVVSPLLPAGFAVPQPTVTSSPASWRSWLRSRS